MTTALKFHIYLPCWGVVDAVGVGLDVFWEVCNAVDAIGRVEVSLVVTNIYCNDLHLKVQSVYFLGSIDSNAI